jgi:N-acetylmuramoyl-L-alanine amidase
MMQGFKSICSTIIFLIFLGSAMAQTPAQPFIRLVNGTREENKVSSSKQFIVGSTCVGCQLFIGSQPVKVYSSGGFATEILLSEGDSSFTLRAQNAEGKSVSKKINFSFTKAPAPVPVSTLSIESIDIWPKGNLVLKAGDRIQFKVKALPGASVSTYNQTALYEMPVNAGNRMPGIYQGEYIVKATDSFANIKFPVLLKTPKGETIQKETEQYFSIFSPLSSDIAITKGRLSFLEYGLGDDRLGGAKIGYLDSLVLLKIVGKVGSDYKVQLAPSLTAYIPDDLVTLMPKGTPTPQSLTGSWSVYGDEKYDYVTVALNTRLPYQSLQETDPSSIIVFVYGATNNTNWISQLPSAKEVKSVDYEQVADEIFKIKIQLHHQQHWGHNIFYRGNNLVIRITRQPENLSLKNLRIAVDAGHGGTNTGAGGPTGSIEKDLALAVSLELQQLLLNEGATVIMTRSTEGTYDNKERILFYRDSLPDLLVSIHLNSSSDPIRAAGTSTHYRYAGYRSLNMAINKRMQELGLKPNGVIGSFNFMLNSPTEYPNSLVESLFISNPEEEDKMLRKEFRQEMAAKIFLGIKDFLHETADRD